MEAEGQPEVKAKPELKQNLRVGGLPVQLTLEVDPENERANLDLILASECLVERAEAFKELEMSEVKHSAEQRVLCVLQREFAVVSLAKVDIVGGDDCTNTALLFLRLGNHVACGHFDYGEELIGTDCCGVVQMASRLEELSDAAETTPYHAWIMGGFLDDKKNSAFIVGILLAALNALARPVELELVCGEKLNDTVRDEVHYPIIMGAAFMRNSQTVVPAHFSHLGPAVGMRTALPCAGKIQMYSCYDTEADEICIEFTYSEFEFVEHLLGAPDEFFMQNLAGCPLQEPPRFCSTLRAGLEFLSKYSDSSEAFPNGPIRFQRSELGAWMRKTRTLK